MLYDDCLIDIFVSMSILKPSKKKYLNYHK